MQQYSTPTLVSSNPTGSQSTTSTSQPINTTLTPASVQSHGGGGGTGSDHRIPVLENKVDNLEKQLLKMEASINNIWKSIIAACTVASLAAIFLYNQIGSLNVAMARVDEQVKNIDKKLDLIIDIQPKKSSK